jgi:hypothetical protein
MLTASSNPMVGSNKFCGFVLRDGMFVAGRAEFSSKEEAQTWANKMMNKIKAGDRRLNKAAR